MCTCVCVCLWCSLRYSSGLVVLYMLVFEYAFVSAFLSCPTRVCGKADVLCRVVQGSKSIYYCPDRERHSVEMFTPPPSPLSTFLCPPAPPPSSQTCLAVEECNSLDFPSSGDMWFSASETIFSCGPEGEESLLSGMGAGLGLDGAEGTELLEGAYGGHASKVSFLGTFMKVRPNLFYLLNFLSIFSLPSFVHVCWCFVCFTLPVVVRRAL